jgi:hypothetical protein
MVNWLLGPLRTVKADPLAPGCRGDAGIELSIHGGGFAPISTVGWAPRTPRKRT